MTKTVKISQKAIIVLKKQDEKCGNMVIHIIQRLKSFQNSLSKWHVSQFGIFALKCRKNRGNGMLTQTTRPQKTFASLFLLYLASYSSWTCKQKILFLETVFLFGLLFGELGFGRSSERRFTKSRSFSRIFAGFDFRGTWARKYTVIWWS